MTVIDGQPALDFDASQSHHQDVATLGASDPRRAADFALFVETVRRDAETHGGCISQNRVRVALTDSNGALLIDPAAYSGMWGRAKNGKRTGPAEDRHGAYIKPLGLEDCRTSLSGNNGKPQRTYEWIGPQR